MQIVASCGVVRRPATGRAEQRPPLPKAKFVASGHLELRRSIQRRKSPVETELAFDEGLPQAVNELTTENLGEDVLRQEEALRRRVDPTAVIE